MAKDSAEFVPKRTAAPEPSGRTGSPTGFLVGAVLLGGLIFAAVQGGWLDQLLSQWAKPAAGESPAPEPKVEAPRVTRNQGGRRRTGVRKERPLLAQARNAHGTPPATPPSPPAVRARAFPTAAEIEAGMSALSIRQAFGAPDMQMTGSDHGRSVEHWVYMSRELAAVTTVILSESKAVSVQTTSRR